MLKVITVFFLIFLVQSSCIGQRLDLLKDFDSHYQGNVVGISKNGIIKGLDAKRKFLVELYDSKGAMQESKSLSRISVNQNLDYEIGSFQMQKGSKFAYLVILEKANGLEKRIFEVVYENSNTNKVPEEISEARKKWMKLCNMHNAKNLVEELYTDDAIYYNRGRLLMGHDKLSQEYSYMNSPSYKLQLTPQHVEIVTDNIAFEIGMCSGSYPLPYMLVWKKQADGVWKIYLDSNY